MSGSSHQLSRKRRQTRSRLQRLLAAQSAQPAVSAQPTPPPTTGARRLPPAVTPPSLPSLGSPSMLRLPPSPPPSVRPDPPLDPPEGMAPLPTPTQPVTRSQPLAKRPTHKSRLASRRAAAAQRLARSSTSPKHLRPAMATATVVPSLGGLVAKALLVSIVLGGLLATLSQLLKTQIPVSSTASLTAEESWDPTTPPVNATLLPLTTPLPDLQAQLAALLTRPGLTVGAMFIDLDTGAYVDAGASQVYSAASVIKVPILVALLQAVDSGEIQLNESLTLTQEAMGGGSGVLQSRPLGSEVSVLEAATLMITVSDNMATNLLILRLGGMETLNQKFRQWGLLNTQLSWLLPDLEGTNTTSAHDMATLLNQIEQGNLLSRRSRDRLLDIMRRTQNQSMLPQGLGTGSRIAHKTGDIRSHVGDVGLVDLPNGRRYLAAVLVKRDTPNDPRAYELVQDLSRVVYQYWSQPNPTSAPQPTPTLTPTPTESSEG
ncbi:MAG: serine hydrolase [Cyanobacteriota bacterium]|nr:serine hydrolase [Cyanobacteriota bacterium]